MLRLSRCQPRVKKIEVTGCGVDLRLLRHVVGPVWSIFHWRTHARGTPVHDWYRWCSGPGTGAPARFYDRKREANDHRAILARRGERNNTGHSHILSKAELALNSFVVNLLRSPSLREENY